MVNRLIITIAFISSLFLILAIFQVPYVGIPPIDTPTHYLNLNIGLEIKYPEGFQGKRRIIKPFAYYKPIINDPIHPSVIDIQKGSAVNCMSGGPCNTMILLIYRYSGNLENFVTFAQKEMNILPQPDRKFIKDININGQSGKLYLEEFPIFESEVGEKVKFNPPGKYEAYFSNKLYGFVLTADQSWRIDELEKVLKGIKTKIP